jgi:hypothetical protein
MSIRLFRVAPLGFALCACYRYAPAETQSVPEGANVRARVTTAAAERIAPLLGLGETRVLVGALVDRNASGSLILEVPTAASTGIGSSLQTLYQRVALAPSEVTELETRRLDRTRTAVVVGGLAAVAVSVAIASLHSNPGIDRPPNGSPAEHRVPVLRWRF